MADNKTTEAFPKLQAMIARVEKLTEEAREVYLAEVQAIANKHGVLIATGHMSDFWQVKKPRARKWLHEIWDDKHPALVELKALDAVASDVRHALPPSEGKREG